MNSNAKKRVSEAKALGASKDFRAVVDDGTREIPLVNRFGKLICNVYIRPADFSILDRYNSMVKDFEAIVEPLNGITIANDGTAQFDKDWEILKSVEDEIKKRFNELFDMEEADAIFEKRNAFSSVGGHFFCENVLLALEQVIVDAVNEEAEKSKARVAKYLAPVDNTEVSDAGSVTENA